MEGLNSGSATIVVGAGEVARTGRGLKWTDGMVDALCALLATGRAYRAVGAELGVSRNAVAGQVCNLKRKGDPRLPAAMQRETVERTCSDCPAPITMWSNGRCRACAQAVQAEARQVPRPSDFVEMSEGRSQLELAEHYGVGVSTVARWFKEAGIVRTGWREASPVPADLATTAPTMSIMELAAHYKVGRNIVRRWLRSTGLRSRRNTAEVFRVNRRPIQPVKRDSSHAGQAATFLQKWGPVYRCGPNGGADVEGTHWNRNGFILSDDELLARAQRLGWEPESWRRLAA